MRETESDTGLGPLSSAVTVVLATSTEIEANVELEPLGNVPCPTVLLGDTPTEEDAFRHREIASAIAGMILTEDGGRAIALTGAWGSGKSTVVALLTRELEKRGGAVTVITFDAWAHQGDPLRRTFLEVAISELAPFLDADKWAERKDILARRLVITDTHAEPQLTGLGAFGALALLLSPVGFQLFSAFTRDNKVVITWPIWTLFGLGTAPLIMGLVVLLVWARSYMQRKHRPFPSLIYSASENRVVTNTSRTAEPTSIEFEQAYCDLLRDAIGESDRKLLVVIDNLDRLDPADAKAIWATLRTFFDKPLRNEPWFHKTWILVPFDGDGLRTLRSSTSGTGVNGDANPFVEKTFQAFFRVPAPLLSNWEAYLYQQLAIALPRHAGSSEFHDIFRVYDNLKELPSDTPTPRQLKLFVNKLGAIHRQWQHQIPLATQAAFLLIIEQSGSTLIKRLQNASNEGFISESVSRRLQGDWQRDMSALYFNVPVDAAFEALLASPISSAIASRQPFALRDLEQSPGFTEVLQRVVEDTFALSNKVDQETLLCASMQMGHLKARAIAYQFSRKLLYDRASSVSSWEDLDDFAGEALAALVAQNDSEPIQALIGSLENSIPLTKSGDLDSEHAPLWLRAVSRFVSLVEPQEVISPVTVKGDATVYLSLVEACVALNIDGLINSLSPADGSSAVLAELAFRASKAEWDAAQQRIVAALVSFKSDWEWDKLSSALAEVVGVTELAEEVTLSMLASINNLHHAGVTRDLDAISTSLNTQTALGNYGALQATPVGRESAAMAVLLLLCPLDLELAQPERRPHPQYQPYQNQFITMPLSAEATRVNAGKTKLKEILSINVISDDPIPEISRQYASARDWRVAAEAQTEKGPFVTYIAEDALHARDSAFFNVGEMLDHIDFWQAELGEEQYTAIVELIGVNQPVSGWLKERAYEKRFEGLYRLVLKGSDDPEINTLVVEGFKAHTAKEWKEVITSNAGQVALISQLRDPQFGVEVEDALFGLASKALESNSTTKLLITPEILLSALSEPARNRFRSRLVNEFGRQEGSFNRVLPIWGSALETALESEGLNNAQERLVQSISRSERDELQWITRLIDRVDRDAKGKVVNRLKSEVREHLKRTEDPAKLTNLREMSSSLGWNFRLPPRPEASQT